jgi:hypothetical protein
MKANTKTKNESGKIALDAVLENGHNAVAWLLKCGPEMEARDDNGIYQALLDDWERARRGGAACYLRGAHTLRLRTR